MYELTQSKREQNVDFQLRIKLQFWSEIWMLLHSAEEVDLLKVFSSNPEALLNVD